MLFQISNTSYFFFDPLSDSSPVPILRETGSDLQRQNHFLGPGLSHLLRERPFTVAKCVFFIFY